MNLSPLKGRNPSRSWKRLPNRRSCKRDKDEAVSSRLMPTFSARESPLVRDPLAASTPNRPSRTKRSRSKAAGMLHRRRRAEGVSAAAATDGRRLTLPPRRSVDSASGLFSGGRTSGRVSRRGFAAEELHGLESARLRADLEAMLEGGGGGGTSGAASTLPLPWKQPPPVDPSAPSYLSDDRSRSFRSCSSQDASESAVAEVEEALRQIRGRIRGEQQMDPAEEARREVGRLFPSSWRVHYSALEEEVMTTNCQQHPARGDVHDGRQRLQRHLQDVDSFGIGGDAHKLEEHSRQEVCPVVKEDLVEASSSFRRHSMNLTDLFEEDAGVVRSPEQFRLREESFQRQDRRRCRPDQGGQAADGFYLSDMF